jgi:capsule polysaccharide export protein KpsE/RkpR
VGGHEFMQPLVVKGDPRIKVSDADLQQQFAVEQKLVAALHQNYTALQELRSLRAQLKDLKPRAQGATGEAVAKLDQQAGALEGSAGGFGAGRGGPQAQSLARLNGGLARVYDVVSLADSAPTTQAVAAADQLQQALAAAISRWTEVQKGIGSLNQQLQGAGLPTIDLRRPAPQQAEDDTEGDEP